MIEKNLWRKTRAQSWSRVLLFAILWIYISSYLSFLLTEMIKTHYLNGPPAWFSGITVLLLVLLILGSVTLYNRKPLKLLTLAMVLPLASFILLSAGHAVYPLMRFKLLEVVYGFLQNSWFIYNWFFWLAVVMLVYWIATERFNGEVPDLSNKKSRIWLLLIIAVTTVVYSAISINRHAAFQSAAVDLGGYDQAVWGFSQFKFLPSSIYVFGNLLGDHFEPVLILLAPFYWIYSSPITLLIIQALLVSLSAWPLFLLFKRVFNNNLNSLLLAVAAVWFIGIQVAIEYDFHPIVIALPVIATVIYCLEAQKWRWYVVSLLGLLLFKETVAVYIVFIGLYALVRKKSKQYGLFALVLGICWYLIAIQFIIPQISGGSYQHLSMLDYVGHFGVKRFFGIIGAAGADYDHTYDGREIFDHH